MIGFLATAYLTFILIIIHYIVDDVPENAHNAVDSLVLKIIRKKVKWNSQRSERWAQAVEKATLMFSDQQLVTGIAILGGGYSQLRNGIQVYHWQIIVDLAWFASCTHLTTMSTLRQYFRARPVVRTWRIISMLIMMVLLIIALAPTGRGDWLLGNGYNGIAAICYFDRSVSTLDYSFDSISTVPMVTSILVLLSSYFTRAIKLFDRSSKFANRWIRRKPSDRMKIWLDRFRSRSGLGRAGPLWLMIHEALLVIFIMLRVLMDLYESMLWEVSTFFEIQVSRQVLFC